MGSPDTPQPEINKALIDASIDGSILFYSECPDRMAPAAFSSVFDRVLTQLEEGGTVLNLRPLRLILFAPELSGPVKDWQRQLGLPEAGVSQQPEGAVGGKTMAWGSDEISARTIVLLNDALAFAATLGNPFALSTVAHEFGHVSDYFLRNLTFGFPTSILPPGISDWPGILRAVADSVWSEYAAESASVSFMSEENLEEFRKNDPLYLAGVHSRIRELCAAFKLGRLQLGALWSRSVTDTFNSFSNLGRAAARLPLGADERAESRRLAGGDGAAAWSPVIEKLFAELRTLAVNRYEGWPPSPFAGIEEAVELGFQALGLFPSYDGSGLRVSVQ